MASLTEINLHDELGDLIQGRGLVEAAVTLVPPKIPLTCFPSAISRILSKVMAKEWSNCPQKSQEYLQWISVKAESIDLLAPYKEGSPTKGFELLAIDPDGRSFGAILERCKTLNIPHILIRFTTLIVAILTIRLLRQQTNLTEEQLSALMFTQNVDAEYLNYPMALRKLIQLFPNHKEMFHLEVNEYVTEDYLTTIRALAKDLDIRLVLDDSNKMKAAVHWQLLDLADWIKIDYQATSVLEQHLAAGGGPAILKHFLEYVDSSGSAVIVLEGLREDSLLKTFLRENWRHATAALYYQSRERIPLPPWNRYFGLIQDYNDKDFGLFFKGI